MADDNDVMDSAKHLFELNIFSGPTALYRAIREQGFPPGRLLGPNTRRWRRGDWRAWVASRPTATRPPRAKKNEAA